MGYDDMVSVMEKMERPEDEMEDDKVVIHLLQNVCRAAEGGGADRWADGGVDVGEFKSCVEEQWVLWARVSVRRLRRCCCCCSFAVCCVLTVGSGQRRSC